MITLKQASVDHIYTMHPLYSKHEFRTRYLSMGSRSPHLKIMILLVARSCTEYPISIDDPLEVLCWSIISGALAHITISGWLIYLLSSDILDSSRSEEETYGGSGAGIEGRELSSLWFDLISKILEQIFRMLTQEEKKFLYITCLLEAVQP